MTLSSKNELCSCAFYTSTFDDSMVVALQMGVSVNMQLTRFHEQS
jgi:hypothetical protein